jgi:hypothetical protein
MRRSMMLCLFALAPATAFADGTSIHGGEWEVTATMNMPGMPTQLPPITYTQCITPKDAAPKPQRNRNRADCKLVDQKVDGGKVTWKVKCAGGAEGTGQIQYSQDTFDGTMTLHVKNPRTGQAMDVQQAMHGVRKGDCKK